MTDEERRYWRERRAAYVQFAASAASGLLANDSSLSEREVGRLAGNVAGHLLARWERCEWPDLGSSRPKKEEQANEVESLRLELNTLRKYVEAIRNE